MYTFTITICTGTVCYVYNIIFKLFNSLYCVYNAWVKIKHMFCSWLRQAMLYVITTKEHYCLHWLIVLIKCHVWEKTNGLFSVYQTFRVSYQMRLIGVCLFSAELFKIYKLNITSVSHNDDVLAIFNIEWMEMYSSINMSITPIDNVIFSWYQSRQNAQKKRQSIVRLRIIKSRVKEWTIQIYVNGTGQFLYE